MWRGRPSATRARGSRTPQRVVPPRTSVPPRRRGSGSLPTEETQTTGSAGAHALPGELGGYTRWRMRALAFAGLNQLLGGPCLAVSPTGRTFWLVGQLLRLCLTFYPIFEVILGLLANFLGSFWAMFSFLANLFGYVWLFGHLLRLCLAFWPSFWPLCGFLATFWAFVGLFGQVFGLGVAFWPSFWPLFGFLTTFLGLCLVF